MQASSTKSPSPRRTVTTERAAWLRTHWDAFVAQATAYYQESQVESMLQELACRESITWERTEPAYRHFGTPEYALHLTWDRRERAGVQIAKTMEIYMGYAGTLLIDGRAVTVLLCHQWRQQPTLVRRALEQAFWEPRVETWVEEGSW